MASYFAEVMADAPVGYWRFDDAAGSSIIHDYSGFGSDMYQRGLILEQPHLVPSDSSECARFNGLRTTSCECENPASQLNIDGAFSIELWVKTESRLWDVSGGAELLQMGGRIFDNPNYQIALWNFGTPTAPNINVELAFIDLTGNYFYHDAAVAFTDGVPHHIVATYNGTSTVNIYFDGKNVLSEAETAIPTSRGERHIFAVGRDTYTDNYLNNFWLFDGYLGQMAIYDTALSAARVAVHWTTAIGTGNQAGSASVAIRTTDAYRDAVLANSPANYVRFDTNSVSENVDEVSGAGWFRRDNGYGDTTNAIRMFPSLLPAINNPSFYQGTQPGEHGYSTSTIGGNYTTAFSLEIWAAFDDTASNHGLMRLTDFSSHPGPVLQWDSSLGLQYGFGYGGGAWSTRLYSYAMSPQLKHPYHIVFTYDSVDGHAKLYLDGALVATQSVSDTPNVLGTGTGVLFMGMDWVNGFSFNGTIDEGAFYTTALSAANVLAHYQAGTQLGSPVNDLRATIPVSNGMASSVGFLSIPVARTLPGGASVAPVAWISPRFTNYVDGDLSVETSDQSGYRNGFYGSGVYTSGIVHGHPVFRFTGTQSMHSHFSPLGDMTAGDAFIVTAAVNDPSTASTQPALWLVGGNAHAEYPNSSGVVKDDAMSTTTHTVGNLVPDLRDFHIYNVASQSADWRAYLDGTQVLADTSNSWSAVFTQIELGASSGSSYTGDIAEFILFDRVLSDGERANWTNYLASAYGISYDPPIPHRDLGISIPVGANPDTITGLAFRYVASDLDATLNDGDQVMSIPDHSTHHNDLNETRTTDWPTLHKAAINGYSALAFNGFASQTIGDTDQAGFALTTFTFYAVYKRTAGHTDEEALLDVGGFDSGGRFFGTADDHLTVSRSNVAFIGDSSTGIIAGDTWYMAMLTFDNVDSFHFYLNGTAVGTLTSSTTFANGDGIWLGSKKNDKFLFGEIAEVGAYDHVLSSGDRDTLTGLMLAKYGLEPAGQHSLQVEIPVKYPYRGDGMQVGVKVVAIPEFTHNFSVATLVAGSGSRSFNTAIQVSGAHQFGVGIVAGASQFKRSTLFTIPVAIKVTHAATVGVRILNEGAGASFISASTVAECNLDTTLTIAKPTGVTSGRLLVAYIAAAYGSDSGFVSAPAFGWTYLESEPSESGSGTLFTYYKVATGGEASTYAFGFSDPLRALGVVLCYDLVDRVTPIYIWNSHRGANSPITHPGFQTSPRNAIILQGAMQADQAVGSVGPVIDGWQLRANAHTNHPNNNLTLIVQDRPLSSGGTTGPATLGTSTNQRWVTTLLSLRPDGA